jgi:hypothetical protein
MKLSDFAVVAAKAPIVFMGELVMTDILSSEGEPYYVGKLKTPVMVGCSVDKDIERHEVDELYIRESDVQSDKWEMVNKKDTSEGYFIPKFVADFSKGQEIEIYQSETIRQWSRGSKKQRGLERTADANLGIREKMAKRAERMGQNSNPDAKDKGKGKKEEKKS